MIAQTDPHGAAGSQGPCTTSTTLHSILFVDGKLGNFVCEFCVEEKVDTQKCIKYGRFSDLFRGCAIEDLGPQVSRSSKIGLVLTFFLDLVLSFFSVNLTRANPHT